MNKAIKLIKPNYSVEREKKELWLAHSPNDQWIALEILYFGRFEQVSAFAMAIDRTTELQRKALYGIGMHGLWLLCLPIS